ncbi:MAG TPA: class I tRNA ligase family protein, partial [Caulobacteraceae bacterium]|nr:class I tRNA ligase family protein [Caulobacteraceae bacterium]
LSREDARKKVLADLEAQGILDHVEDKKIMVPFDEKSKLVVIEPYLTDQWYVDAKTLAQPAIRAVEEGRTVFQPKVWEKTYFDWMRNIEPWCVSRQLWWGHRIPAWYGLDGRIFVAETADEAQAQALEVYGREEALLQDEDVLDTWFSSALWPFSTLGWPDETEDLKRFYPTHTLVTGFDIIFFWVARMMMMGLKFMDEVPFRRVFINALIRDEQGAKMSKSKGNVLDPLELIDQYGCDALRFTLTAMSGQARDIKLSRQRIEGYRNFGTKLWNVARFCQVNGCTRDDAFDPASAQLVLNRWIRGEAAKTTREVTQALEACAFADAAAGLYRFIWNIVCDWYVELAKPILNGADEAAKAETRAMAAWVLETCLRLLHPISPFITEALWEDFGDGRGLLISASWPQLPHAYVDEEAQAEIALIIAAIGEGRSVRAELNVPAAARPPLLVVEADARQRQALSANAASISQLLRISELRFDAPAEPGAVPYLAENATFALPVADFIDVAAERTRLAKEIATLTTDAERTAKKLANPDFVARAPEEVVEENRERLAEARAAATKLETALSRLAQVS